MIRISFLSKNPVYTSALSGWTLDVKRFMNSWTFMD